MSTFVAAAATTALLSRLYSQTITGASLSSCRSPTLRREILGQPLFAAAGQQTPPAYQDETDETWHILCYGDSLTHGTSPPNENPHPYAPHMKRVLMDFLETKKESSKDENSPSRYLPKQIEVTWKGLPGWTASSMVEHASHGDVGLESAISQHQREHEQPFRLAVILAGTNDLGHEIMSRQYSGELAPSSDSMDKISMAAAESISRSIVALHNMAHRQNVVETIAVSVPPSAWQSSSYEATLLCEKTNTLVKSWCTGEDSTKTRSSFVEFPLAYKGPTDKHWSHDGLHLSPLGYQELGEKLAENVAQVIFLRHK